ncbi:hypothetical protein HK098_006646 [Nowakowskiella sp. JEL0407]|nr:hypothetical protein HK098_006646 [Nowakowskiella sp. JEL0407]
MRNFDVVDEFRWPLISLRQDPFQFISRHKRNDGEECQKLTLTRGIDETLFPSPLKIDIPAKRVKVDRDVEEFENDEAILISPIAIFRNDCDLNLEEKNNEPRDNKELKRLTDYALKALTIELISIRKIHKELNPTNKRKDVGIRNAVLMGNVILRVRKLHALHCT